MTSGWNRKPMSPIRTTWFAAMAGILETEPAPETMSAPEPVLPANNVLIKIPSKHAYLKKGERKNEERMRRNGDRGNDE